MTGALRPADHASEPTVLPASVGAFAAVVEDLDRRLRAIDDSKLDLFWAWETYDEEGVRFGIRRTTEQGGGRGVQSGRGRLSRRHGLPSRPDS